MTGLPRKCECGAPTKRVFRQEDGTYVREYECGDEWQWDPRAREHYHAVLYSILPRRGSDGRIW